ncbi:MAG TPA: FAD-dependent oxidoreductase [Solirubrobacterales bacterium]
MARTPLAQFVEDGAAQAAPGITRREAIRRAGIAGAGLALSGTLAAPARGATAPRIVVVGAGLAGLSAAYDLQQAGYAAQVHEAHPSRVGGRCWSIRSFSGGQIAEHGGELIDQGHTQLRQLAQELGLELDNLLQAEVNGTDPFHYFDGAPYSYEEATDDLKEIWQQLHKDVSAASYPTLYNSSTQRGRELDAMSIADWIQAYVPGGMGSKLGQLLDVAYNIEYGAETSVQSSLNMLYLLAYSGQGQLRIFGPSNEKYHVRGGNDQIPARLAAALQGQITTGSALTSIRRNADGTYRLGLQSGSSATTVSADHVVLALPFSILRTLDYAKAGFSAVKTTAIEEMGMGTNSKLHVQFKDRLWSALGCTGETYADTGYQNTWEVTRAQPGKAGILVDYTGGNIGASFGTGTPAERAAQFLAQIEPVLPGISSRWNGKATIDFWTGYQWTKGSYSYWKVGQYTKFAGAEREPEGNCHFAGEHTSIDFQGYLNGAVESGERAAGEIIAAYK